MLLKVQPLFQYKLPVAKIQVAAAAPRRSVPLRMCIPAFSSRPVLPRPPAPRGKQSLAPRSTGEGAAVSPGGWGQGRAGSARLGEPAEAAVSGGGLEPRGHCAPAGVYGICGAEGTAGEGASAVRGQSSV